MEYLEEDGVMILKCPTIRLTPGSGDEESSTFIRETGIGIGVSHPNAKLDLRGQIKIRGGSPGTGKVLTSNASGLATWQTPASSSLWSSGGDNIYFNDGNVGIQTPSPKSKLSVGADGHDQYNIYSLATQASGIGIYSLNSGDGGTGVKGLATSTSGKGIAGTANASSGETVGGEFNATSPDGFGVYASGGNYGVYGTTNSSNRFGIGGYFKSESDNGVGAYAWGDDYDFYAGNTDGRSYFSGKVGIGSFPSAKLSVGGTIKIEGGSPGEGKLLTSDDEGLASWETPMDILVNEGIWLNNGSLALLEPYADIRFLNGEGNYMV